MVKKVNKGISAAIIMLDEAELLSGFLNHLIPVVDEIILIDGGSKDNSVDIAVSKGLVVYKNKWEHNYPKQRNLAIEKCTKEWILSIDVDERLSPEFIRFLGELRKADTKAEGFLIAHHHFIDGKELHPIKEDPDWHVRVFRNNGRIKWSTLKPIDERLIGFTGVLPQFVVPMKLDVHFIHDKTLKRSDERHAYYVEQFGVS